jgi:hypothetical protein
MDEETETAWRTAEMEMKIAAMLAGAGLADRARSTTALVERYRKILWELWHTGGAKRASEDGIASCRRHEIMERRRDVAPPHRAQPAISTGSWGRGPARVSAQYGAQKLKVLTRAQVSLAKYFSVTNIQLEKAAKPAEKIMRGWLYPMEGAHLLGKTGKRAAERSQRAETPCKNPACRVLQRYQRARVHAVAAGLRRWAWRKLAETLLQKLGSRNGPQFCYLTQGVHPRSRLA